MFAPKTSIMDQAEYKPLYWLRFRRMRISTDVGGTFTDLIEYDTDEAGRPVHFVTHKVESTPPEFERGVMNAVAAVDAKETTFFVHGSTVVINALLSRNGAKTGLLTTRGFRDVLEIARGDRPDLYNFYFRKPPPFIPRYRRREISERTDAQGQVLRPPELTELPNIVDDFRRDGVESIAVCFLHAYTNSENEQTVVRELKRLWPEISVLASSDICREWREYERTSTVVLSAFVHPVTFRYLDTLTKGLQDKGFAITPHIMQSNGGITTVDAAVRNPVSMVESGPAGGVLGAVALGEHLGVHNLATVDIGGTTAKCSLIPDLVPKITTDYYIERTAITPGYPIKTPVIEIVEIGSGGGSIAFLDDGSKLHVGPESAGAQPGPAVYGRGGTEPTTTDAHILTRRIDANNLLGGRISADLDAVNQAFAPLSEKLQLPIPDIARGILRLANTDMANALKLVSVNKGYDPRDFTLVAYGGGGALHAVALGEALCFAKVIVPSHPAVFSAWGMLVADWRRDFLRTFITELSPLTATSVTAGFEQLKEHALTTVGRHEHDSRLTVECYGDLRYQGQEHTVKIPFSSTLAENLERFHDAHSRAYSFKLDRQVELVTMHVTIRRHTHQTRLQELPCPGKTLEQAQKGTRVVDFDEDGCHETNIYDRAVLEPDMCVNGPAVIEEEASTCLLPPGRSATVDTFGNLHLTIYS